MQTNYTIKKATTADVPLIKALALATWEPTYQNILTKDQIDYMFDVIYSEEALRQQMKYDQTFLLIYMEDKPIGFAAYSIKDTQQNIYKLNKIYVLPDCQGTGAGKILLTHIEQEVKHIGGTILDLNVNRHNQAKKFYERCGYEVHEEEDIAIGPYWMNDYIMRKKLTK